MGMWAKPAFSYRLPCAQPLILVNTHSSLTHPSLHCHKLSRCCCSFLEAQTIPSPHTQIPPLHGRLDHRDHGL